MFYSDPPFKIERCIPSNAGSVGCNVALNCQLSTEIASAKEVLLTKGHIPFQGQHTISEESLKWYIIKAHPLAQTQKTLKYHPNFKTLHGVNWGLFGDGLRSSSPSTSKLLLFPKHCGFNTFIPQTPKKYFFKLTSKWRRVNASSRRTGGVALSGPGSSISFWSPKFYTGNNFEYGIQIDATPCFS